MLGDMLEMYPNRRLLFVFCNPRKHLISEKENNRASAESVLEMCELHIVRKMFPGVTCVATRSCAAQGSENTS